MGEANSHGNAHSPAQAASAPPFDRSRTQPARRAATMRLLARLKAIDSTQEAPSARACQRLCPGTRAADPRLDEAGVGTEEIVVDLALSLPSIWRAALRHAIGEPRDARVQDEDVAPRTMP